MKKSLFIRGLFLLCLVVPFVSFAEGPKMIFEENKNQWPEQVKYMTDIVNGRLFLEKNTFTYVFMDNSTSQDHAPGQGIVSFLDPAKVINRAPVMKFHAFKVNFENSNPNVELSGNNLLQGIRNYYIGNDEDRKSVV